MDFFKVKEEINEEKKIKSNTKAVKEVKNSVKKEKTVKSANEIIPFDDEIEEL